MAPLPLQRAGASLALILGLGGIKASLPQNPHGLLPEIGLLCAIQKKFQFFSEFKFYPDLFRRFYFSPDFGVKKRHCSFIYRSSYSGVTVVELLIGLVIFLSVVIPIAAGFNFGAKNTRSLKMRNEAIELLTSRMDEILLMPFQGVDNDLVFTDTRSILTGVVFHLDVTVTKVPQTYEVASFWDKKQTKSMTYNDFKEITLSVQWEDAGRKKSLSLVSALGDKQR